MLPRCCRPGEGCGGLRLVRAPEGKNVLALWTSCPLGEPVPAPSPGGSLARKVGGRPTRRSEELQVLVLLVEHNVALVGHEVVAPEDRKGGGKGAACMSVWTTAGGSSSGADLDGGAPAPALCLISPPARPCLPAARPASMPPHAANSREGALQGLPQVGGEQAGAGLGLAVELAHHRLHRLGGLLQVVVGDLWGEWVVGGRVG